MDLVAEMDTAQLWDHASQEVLRRTARLARRLFDLPASTVRFVSAKGDVVVSSSAPDDLIAQDAARKIEEGDEFGSIVAPLRLSCGRALGTLQIVAPSRLSNDHDRALFSDLADQLAHEIELAHRTAVAETVATRHAKLSAVADHIPGLIFERRKVDAGRSTYTFFGSDKVGLPAVRQMMKDNISGLSFIHRDDRGAVRAAILRSNVEETDLDLTFRIKDFDRNIRWVRSQSIVRHDVDGTVCWDGICFDVTDLVAANDTQGATIVTDEAVARRFALIAASNGRRSDETAREEADDNEAPSRQTGARILLADDLDLNRKLIADMLTYEGHVVDCVADGVQAVQAAGQHDYDLILMDMVMPVMDGVAAAAAIRSLPSPYRSVPIVALTANSAREQLDSCLNAGMNAALTKPMSMDALMAAVARWTQGREAA